MTTVKTKVLTYKACTIDPLLDGQTLESLVRDALALRRTARGRMQLVDPTADRRNFINHYQGATEDYLGFEFISYERGADPGGFQMDDEREVLEIETLLPPDGEREAVHGALYGLVRENHVVVVQSAALRAKQLEEYFIWLFGPQQTGLLPETSTLHLADCPDPEAVLARPKKIVLKSPIHRESQDEQESTRATAESQRERVRVVPGGASWKALKEFLRGVYDLPSWLEGDDATLAHGLEVTLTLQVPRAPRNAESNLLTNVAMALRHVEDEIDYAITTDMGVITSNQVKIRHSETVRWGRVRPLWDDIFPKMKVFLRDLVRQRRVPV